jgi:septum formation topological specificity factor MinE
MFERELKVTVLDAVTLERRLEILKLEGNGLEPCEIVKELSVKYRVSERAIYKDFESRNSWQPQLQEMKKTLLKVINRHEQLYRKAVVAYMQAKSDRARIAALNLMRQINEDIAEMSGAKTKGETETEEIRIKWEDPKTCTKQQ